MFDPEGHLRAHEVLERALRSSSRITRVRAVSMLARYDCSWRTQWLERACLDPDDAVRHTAIAVMAWSTEGDAEAAWPDREDPAFDRVPRVPAELDLRGDVGKDEGWHYVLEVWRHDGMLVGVFFAVTHAEDDEHARRMALGQAIITTAGQAADSFDPATAAVFIVEKHPAGDRSRTPDAEGLWPQSG